MRRALKIGLFGTLGLVLGAGAFMVYKIGPSNLWGMLRYDQREEGTLVVGDVAPDVALVGLDGTSRVNLHERLEGKPLVLVFGSFT
jgi:hypothetical protein